jgi:hypothetical protein
MNESGLSNEKNEKKIRENQKVIRFYGDDPGFEVTFQISFSGERMTIMEIWNSNGDDVITINSEEVEKLRAFLNYACQK